MGKRRVISLALAVLAIISLFPGGPLVVTLAQNMGEAQAWGRSRFVVPAGWSEPISIPSSGSDPRNPVLVVDRYTGRLHLAWEEAGTIRYAYYDEAGWHGDAFALAGDSPALALDAEGRPHLAYASIINHQLDILHCVRDPQGWSAPSLVSGTGGLSTDPDLSIIINGEIHIVWTEKLEGAERIYHARSADNGRTWQAAVPIPGAYGYAPALALAPEGRVWVAWQGDKLFAADGTTDIFAAAYLADAWSLPFAISQALGGDSGAPDLVCGPDGRAHLFWQEELQGRMAVWWAAGTLEGWGVPVCLSPATAQGWRPYAALGLDGRVYVAWEALGSGERTTRLAFARLGPEDRWEMLDPLYSPGSNMRDVALAIDPEGTLYVVWRQLTPEGRAVLLYSRRPAQAGTPTPAPSATPSATATPEMTVPPATSTPTPSPTATATWTATPTPSATATATPTVTSSATPTLTPSATVTPSPTATATATWTPLPAKTPRAFVPAVLNADLGSMTPVPLVHRPAQTPTPPRLAGGAGWAWSATENVSVSETDSGEPALAVAPDGTIFAVWEELYAGRSLLYYSLRRGGTWSAPVGFFVGREPALAVGPDGQVHLVFAYQAGGNYEIYYTTWTGRGWGPPQNISATSSTSTQPSIAVQGDGNPIVVWTETNGGQPRIYYAWRSNGLWNSYIVPNSSGGSTPAVAWGQNQNLWVAWQAKEIAGSYEIYALRRNGGAWSSLALNLSQSPDTDSLAPRLAGDPSVGVLAVWREERSGASEIYYTDNLRYVEWWEEPERVSVAGVWAELPAVAVTSCGDAYVAWREGAQLLARRRQAGGEGWAPQEVVATGLASGSVVRLDAGLQRSLHLVWSQPALAGDQDIYYRSGGIVWPYAFWLPLVAKP
jgi:hypothetical protein